MVQDEGRSNHERKIKQYVGVDDIGDVTEGVWIEHADPIKRNTPRLFDSSYFEAFKSLFDWLLKHYKDDLTPAYSALFMLDQLSGIIRNAKEIHTWGLLGNDLRQEKVTGIITAIERLEKLLQDEDIPPLPPAIWFLASPRGMWHDREVSRVTYRWCRKNNVCHPTELGLGNLLAELKNHTENMLKLKKAAVKTGMSSDKKPSRRAEAMIFSRRLTQAMRHVFNLKDNPNAIVAVIVHMEFPDIEGITAETVQEWNKPKRLTI